MPEESPRLVHVSTVRRPSTPQAKIQGYFNGWEDTGWLLLVPHASVASICPCVTGLAPWNGTVPFDSYWSIAGKSRIRSQWV